MWNKTKTYLMEKMNYLNVIGIISLILGVIFHCIFFNFISELDKKNHKSLSTEGYINESK